MPSLAEGLVRAKRALRDEGRALERLLLPNCCVVCDQCIPSREPDELLCGVCELRLATVPLGCARCSQPLPLVGECRFCAQWPLILERARSAVWMGPEARALVHHFKYDDYPSLGASLARILRKRVSRPESGCLVPIPMAPRKLRMRGYNQALVLAKELGRRWKLPVAESALRRTRETRTQTALTPNARLANVAAAFAASPAPARSRAILVDDVLTTGATLRTAALALADAGWTAVEALTFARALPFDVRIMADG